MTRKSRKNPYGNWGRVSKKVRKTSVRRGMPKRCFLLPSGDRPKFPICDKDGHINCGAIHAAYTRARQWRYDDVANKALRLKKKLCAKMGMRFSGGSDIANGNLDKMVLKSGPIYQLRRRHKSRRKSRKRKSKKRKKSRRKSRKRKSKKRKKSRRKSRKRKSKKRKKSRPKSRQRKSKKRKKSRPKSRQRKKSR